MHVTDIRYASDSSAPSRLLMKEHIMKIVIATLAFAALLTSPALAQYQYGAWRSPYYGAYAQQFGPYARYYGARRTPFDVYDTRGYYVGSDPDTRIRDSLARDPPNRD
jgi:hypothetical protein